MGNLGEKQEASQGARWALVKLVTGKALLKRSGTKNEISRLLCLVGHGDDLVPNNF